MEENSNDLMDLHDLSSVQLTLHRKDCTEMKLCIMTSLSNSLDMIKTIDAVLQQKNAPLHTYTLNMVKKWTSEICYTSLDFTKGGGGVTAVFVWQVSQKSKHPVVEGENILGGV